MKTKIKRHYRSAVSVLLSVCMLISCMTVGLIATDAARVDDDSAVADPSSSLTFHLWPGDHDTTLAAKDTWYDVYTTGANNETVGFSLKDGSTEYCNGEGFAASESIGSEAKNRWMNSNTSYGFHDVILDANSTYQVRWTAYDSGNNKIQIDIRKKPTEYTVSLNSVDHATAVVTYSGGEIAESGSANLEAGTSVTVVVTPDSGYVATTVSVNGGSAIALTDMGNGTYTYTYTVNAATAFTLGSTKPKAASSVTLTPALTELTTAGAAATLTATAVSPVDNALTYKLYTDAGTLVDTKPVTDGGAAEFTVTPSVDISKYYVTVEKTSDSTYASVKSTTVKVTNSAYVTAKYALTGRIIDKSDSYWDTNATNNSKQLNVNEHMSGSVFRYKYVPSEHGTPTDASHVDFRLINTSNTSKIYGGNANPQTMLNKMYYTTKASPGGGCYRLPDYTGSYYIYVDQSTEPPMIWCEKIPSTSVKIYAKDGVIRRNAGSDSDSEYWRFAARANTVLTKASGSTKNLTNYNASANTYYEYGEMEKGGSITLTTTLESSLKDYYIKGYSINGVVYQLLDPPALDSNNKSVSTYTFAIPEDFPDDYLEITPIYFKRSNEGCITFYVEGYDEEVQRSGWGNTIFADFFYASGHDEGYPGQPMVYYGGRYFMQVSTTGNKAGDTGTLGKIMGVTLNNGQWDYVHCDQVKAVGDNKQTYDFSNFHKIYTEKSDDNLDAITFSFKYENKLDNFGRSINYPTTITESTFDSDNGNGWEYLTNYYKEKVDIFGNVLTDEQAAQEPLLIVSNGYVSGYEGKYATEWAIYNSTGTSKLGVIPSSALVLESADRFDSTDYSDASGAPRTLSGYKSTYNALKDESKALYKPAIITFEKDVYSNSGMKTDGSADGNQYGYRLDGLWYFSQKNRQVSANVEIEYSENYYSAFSPKWYKDEFAGSTNVGTYTQTKAYFTDTGFENQTTEGPVTADSTQFYNFTAEATGKWMLKGWYLKDGDKYIEIVSPSLPAAQSARDANATFVARFVPYPSGTVYISHEIKPGSEGLATATVNSVWIADDTNDTNIAAITTNNGDVSAIGSQYISTANKNKYLKIQLDTTPASGADLLGFYYDVQKTDPIVYNALTQGTDIVENKITVPAVSIPSKQAVIYVKIDHFFRHNDTTDEDEFIEDKDTLKFYSELEVQNYSVTITKDIDNDLTTDWGDYTNFFPIKISVSHDNGTTFTQIITNLPCVDYQGNKNTNIDNCITYGTERVHAIRQGDKLTLSGLAATDQVRVEELRTNPFEDGTTANSNFNSNFAVALNNYTYKSITAQTQATPPVAVAHEGEGGTHFESFVVGTHNLDITVTNEVQMVSLDVQKLFSDFNYADESTFDFIVTYKPLGANSQSYLPLKTGTAQNSAVTATATGEDQNIYTVKKTGKIRFANIPKGSRICVNEPQSSIGVSNVTNGQRFAYDHAALASSPTSQIDNGDDFTVVADDTLTVYNKVKKNEVDITKAITIPDHSDTDTVHTIEVTVCENGNEADSVPLNQLEYKLNERYRLDESTPATVTPTPVTCVDGKATITLKAQQNLYFLYPVGSKFTVKEIDNSATNGYTLTNVTVSNAADMPAPSAQGSNPFTFYTADKMAKLTITNSKIYNYTINYTYPSRYNNLTKQKLYGDQTYTVTGSIKSSDDNFSTYIDYEHKTVRQALVKAKNPFESDFMYDFVWDLDSVVYNPNGAAYTANVTTTTPTTQNVYVTFEFPYDYTNATGTGWTGTSNIYSATSDNPAKTAYKSPAAISIGYQKVPHALEPYTYRDEDNVEQTSYRIHCTTAPEKCGGKDFLYWSIREKAIGSDEWVEVAKCYTNEYTYATFNDYHVRPIFDGDEEADNTTEENKSEATIKFLDTSRNQWNNNQKGTKSTSYAGQDMVYADFDVAYRYKGQDVDDSTDLKVGVLIENIGTIEQGYLLDHRNTTTADGKTAYTNSLNHYKDTTYYAYDAEAIKTYLSSVIKDGKDPAVAQTAYQTSLGTLGTSYTLNLKQRQPDQTLTNMNRVEYYHGSTVRSIAGNATDKVNEWTVNNANTSGVFRAYSYIVDAEGNVTLSEPTYYTLYGTATLDHLTTE